MPPMVLAMAAQFGIAKNGAVLIGQAQYRSLRRGGDGGCSVPATMAALYAEVAVPRQMFLEILRRPAGTRLPESPESRYHMSQVSIHPWNPSP